MDNYTLKQIAKEAAALHGRAHAYTRGSQFEPHDWVLKAMERALQVHHDSVESAYQSGYDTGYDEGRDMGYDEGYEAASTVE